MNTKFFCVCLLLGIFTVESAPYEEESPRLGDYEDIYRQNWVSGVVPVHNRGRASPWPRDKAIYEIGPAQDTETFYAEESAPLERPESLPFNDGDYEQEARRIPLTNSDRSASWRVLGEILGLQAAGDKIRPRSHPEGRTEEIFGTFKRGFGEAAKRSPSCIRRCVAQGDLHPAQCHSLC